MVQLSGNNELVRQLLHPLSSLINMTTNQEKLIKTKMAERQLSKVEKRERQLISIPFIWEIRPGTPKKDWKPVPPQFKPGAPPPIKLTVSVPFRWEEKPGTPYPSFTQSSIDSDHEDGYWSAGDSVVDAFSESETETNYASSAPRFLANGVISASSLSCAVPVQENSLALVPVNYVYPQSPYSETDSESGYPRSTSLAGASFLEWLFPLLVKNSSSQEKIREKEPSRELLQLTNYSQVGRPLPTLGELIIISRRRSCQRKNMNFRKQPSMDFMKRNGFGCFIFGSGNSFSGLQKKWKEQLHLKFI